MWGLAKTSAVCYVSAMRNTQRDQGAGRTQRSVKMPVIAADALRRLAERYHLTQAEVLGLLVERWTVEQEPDIAKKAGLKPHPASTLIRGA